MRQKSGDRLVFAFDMPLLRQVLCLLTQNAF
jgi:hypothetical protein